MSVGHKSGDPLHDEPVRVFDGDFLSCWINTLPEQDTNGTCSCQESSGEDDPNDTGSDGMDDEPPGWSGGRGP